MEKKEEEVDPRLWCVEEKTVTSKWAERGRPEGAFNSFPEMFLTFKGVRGFFGIDDSLLTIFLISYITNLNLKHIDTPVRKCLL